MSTAMLGAVIALAAWTHVMWLWMYVTRIPATAAAKIALDPQVPRGEQMAQLPARVRWKADNYNHLMEQPTVFYAVALALAMLGAHGWEIPLAWTYVGLRVVHSLVQATWNKIPVRFTIFAISTVPLIVLTVRAGQLVVAAGVTFSGTGA